jgi:flagellar basal-body rod protein FlgC
VPFPDLFAGSAISGTGMSAERFRMEVIANNIANAQSTRGPNGEPFRRQDVVFAEVLGGTRADGTPELKGVSAVDLVDDPTPFDLVYMPGHPDADKDTGMVKMPNVKLPVEMVNLLTATRAYEANLKAAQAFRTMNEQALVLLRG